MLHNTVTLSYVTRGVTVTATGQHDTSAFRVDLYRTRCFALKQLVHEQENDKLAGYNGLIIVV